MRFVITLSLSVVVAGCTVRTTANDPAPPLRDEDSSTPPVSDGGCGLPVERALGPYADRVSCPMPLSLPLARTDAGRAALAVLEAMSVALCEQDRARASWLEPDAWEIEQAASWEMAPGEMEFRFGERGLEHLAPTPSERWTACTIEERALEWVEAHRAIYFITADDVQLSVAGSSADGVVLEQAWRGIPVWQKGARLVWDERRARFSEVRSWLLSASQMPETEVPIIDRAEALRRIAPVSATPTLLVWPALEGRARLVWVVYAPGSNDRYVIDAMSGEVEVTHCDATELCGL